MGRRHKKARFKPDVYVFPGGMIERSDHVARPVGQLDRSVTAKLAVGGSHPRAQALAMAAIRETFEETGLIVGSPGDVGTSSDAAWTSFRNLGVAPALDKLHYLGRAVTPTAQPMRFHARFFSINASEVTGDINPREEVEDLQWVAVDNPKGLDMMQVTQFMLDTLAGHLGRTIKKSPFISFQRGKPRILWQ
jgi:8-oxo-dGTP pyrophosphatase MutT (NUDIX family)